jgi:hypothetical protein
LVWSTADGWASVLAAVVNAVLATLMGLPVRHKRTHGRIDVDQRCNIRHSETIGKRYTTLLVSLVFGRLGDKEDREVMDEAEFTQSLRNRVRAMNTLWLRAIADLTPDQINHHERSGVLPLAFSFVHFVRAQDMVVSRFILSTLPLWELEEWAQRSAIRVEQLGREETVAEMEHQQIGNLDAFRAYLAKVVDRSDAALEETTAEELGGVVIDVLPVDMENSYCALVVGRGSAVRKLEVWECFVYQHGLRHMGEVEHGRSLVGLNGMTR